MARAKKQTITKDPVFAEIEKHQKAMREFYAALKVVRGTRSPDPRKERKYGNREIKAIERLTSTAPTTLQGLLALVTYINGVSNGEFSNGKHDNSFDEEESLYSVLANAEKLLAEQIGRAA